MKRSVRSILWLALCGSVACGGGSGTTPSPSPAMPSDPEPMLRSDVPPITSVDEAKPGVFIPPHLDCRAPLAGETGHGPGGQVCTQVGIAGCTEEGKYFPDYGSCDIVRTERPYWPAKAAGSTAPDDPRLQDAAFMSELAWVTSQARATACTCCHDSRQAPMGASQWAIDAPGIWTDTASNAAIALFAGLSDSSLFGSFAPEQNNGFQRSTTGLPSTDGARMRAFFVAELTRRGITEAQAMAFPPFGGPFLENQRAKPTACTKGEGVDAAGHVSWSGGAARYVYILDPAAANPGAPPNFDLPDGTLWRLDVLASADAVHSGVKYGTTPAGTVQSFPTAGRAPALQPGRSYHLFVLSDVALVSNNCLFTYGG